MTMIPLHYFLELAEQKTQVGKLFMRDHFMELDSNFPEIFEFKRTGLESWVIHLTDKGEKALNASRQKKKFEAEIEANSPCLTTEEFVALGAINRLTAPC